MRRSLSAGFGPASGGEEREGLGVGVSQLGGG